MWAKPINVTTSRSLTKLIISTPLRSQRVVPAFPRKQLGYHIRPCQSIHTFAPRREAADTSNPINNDVTTRVSQYIESFKDVKVKPLETINIADIEAPHTGVIRILLLNRHHARNAISKQLLKELDEQIEAIHGQGPSGNVRVLVIASESNESFCAGADLKERKTMSQDE